MVDTLDPEARSNLMGRVRQKNTKPELIVRSTLHALGYRFRLHRRDLPGKPDITLPRHKSIVFVHGCFWHGHDCPRGRLPKTRTAFWKQKIKGNRMRDKAVIEELKNLGYRVIVIWECETKDRPELEQLILRALPTAEIE
jgi:DNA mismatch endonuclease (patch repair protein)